MFLRLNLKHKEVIILIILSILILAPFLNKAFNLDDTVELYLARGMLNNPVDFSGVTINWSGSQESILALSDSPLISCFMAFIIAFLGEKELWMHLVFLIFPLSAVISMYFLSRRFNRYPLFSTLLLLCSPVFIISATNVVPHIAGLAFFLAAITAFIYGIDRENKPLLIAAGFLAGFAVMTKYSSFTIIPLFFLYAFLKRKLSRGILSLSILSVLLVAWSLHDLILLRKIQFLEGFLYWFKPSFSASISGIFACLTYISAVTVCPLLYLVFFEKRKDWFVYLYIACLTFIFSWKFIALLKLGLEWRILFVSFISFAIFVCQKLLERLIREKNDTGYADSVFLLSWLGLVICYDVFIVTWFMCPKYILILIAPLILLLMKKYDKLLSGKRSGIFRKFIWVCIILNLLLSLAVSFADYIYADTYRNFTNTYGARLKEKTNKVWFRGHWGFQYYMEKKGFRYLGTSDIARKEEIIVTPSICDQEPLSKELKVNLKLVGSIKYETNYPLRSFSPKAGINFYSYTMESLPYGVSTRPLEEFSVWQVQ